MFNGADVNVEEYLYDYVGNRIAKIQEFKTTYYLVDTNGALSQVLAEYDENGSLTTLYTRGSELISQERNGEKSYYLYDGFDSVRMLANDECEITDTYVYDAFGNLTSSTGETENSFLYRGEQFDSFTGLYYLRARYMNPSTGTFITMDEYAGSIFEPVSLHKYLYANANPVMNSDPSGYEGVADNYSLKGLMVGMACLTILSAIVLPNYSKWVNSISFANNTSTFNASLTLFEIKKFCEGLLSGATTSLIVVKETVETLIGELQILVDKQIKDKTEPIYTVYTLVDSEGNVRYVGRTKYYSARITAHASPESKNKDLIPGSKIEHLTYAQARALEQTLMVHCHTRNWLNEVGNNSINGISPNNSNKTEYFKSLEELFKNEYLENQIDNEFLNLVENNSLLY